VRKLCQEAVDLRLGTDVDAMSRLIDNEQGGMPSKPFGKHYLLLITA